jgi:hypothetical protein
VKRVPRISPPRNLYADVDLPGDPMVPTMHCVPETRWASTGGGDAERRTG